jgi:hypothetical protein
LSPPTDEERVGTSVRIRKTFSQFNEVDRRQNAAYDNSWVRMARPRGLPAV